MSGLKSAWELSMEKADKMNPESGKKLSDQQKRQIGDIRKEVQAQIADKDIALQHKLKTLSDRLPPERATVETEELKKKFIEEKRVLEKEMEDRVEAVHKQKGH